VIKTSLAISCVATGLLSAVACGASSSAVKPSSSSGASTRVAATRTLAPFPTPTGCGAGPARRAWAEAVSASGRVIWQDKLPTNPTQSGINLQPVVIGGTGFFAEYQAVYALRLTDGHQLWQRSFPQAGSDPFSGMVYGLWQWHGSVIVLIGQVSTAARLMSLNPATGAVRWTLPLRNGLTGSQALTGDGGLAMLWGYATLKVADLATGRIRWSRTAGHSPGPVAVGGVVVAAAEGKDLSAGSVMGYDARTGKLLWTRHGMPNQPRLQVTPGRVLVYSDTQLVYPRPVLWPVTALSSATGRTLWRAGTTGPVDMLSAGPSGIAVSTVNPIRLYLINPLTGRVRWNRPFADTNAPLDTGSDLVYFGSAPGTSQPLVDVRAATGTVRWTAAFHRAYGPDAMVSSGADVVLPFYGQPDTSNSGLSAFRLATGKAAWTVKVPTLVQVPLAVAGADLLVQPTDPVVACPAAAAVEPIPPYAGPQDGV
jgi:outer membrane protein assembly factor BamB